MKPTRLGYRWLACSFLSCLVSLVAPARAEYSVLHHFTGTATDGGNPLGALLLDGSTLYGMTSIGGGSNRGVVFRLNTDGSGFTNLHSFAGGNTDGSNPHGSLILAGDLLYGLTYAGGTNNIGTAFALTTNGANFKLLLSFNGGSLGQRPGGTLLRLGGVLYGMTDIGDGSYGYGTIFKIRTNGTSFSVLRNFSGSTSDGGWPGDRLIAAGATLYGGTEVGGSSWDGTVFQIQTNGTSFQILHSFTDADGHSSKGALTRVGAMLFGTAVIGGTSNAGTAFTVGTNGSGFAVLHNFGGPPNDGVRPYRQVQLVNDTLVGTSYGGGNNNTGTVFQVATNATSSAILHHFAGGTNDGCNPIGELTVSGPTFYGMTFAGGSNNLGVIYALTPEGPTISTASPLLSGTVGIPYTLTLAATNGIAPYSWAIVTNDLPSGLLLQMTTGAITGTPTTATVTNFTVQVTGADGRSTTKEFSLTIDPTPFEQWQLQYFGCTDCSSALASADPLGKGISNFDQFRAGLNPTNANSLFQILSIISTDTALLVTWQTAGGHTNIVETTSDLAGNYTNVSPNIMITGSGDTTTNYWMLAGP